MKLYTPRAGQPIPVLWESKPERGDKRRHGFQNHTVEGYLAVGRRRASHLARNNAAISKKLSTPWHYPFAGTVTVLQELAVNDHKKLWARIVKEFVKLGVFAAWEREITRKNQINYHLVIREAPEALMRHRARKLRTLIRAVTTVKLNQHYKPLKTYADARKWWNYCNKLKFSDTRPNTKTDDVDCVTSDKVNPDVYNRKRVLFKKAKTGQRLLRHGDFPRGQFWEQSPTTSTNDYKHKKRDRKAKNQARPDVQEAAKEWADIIGLHLDAVEALLHKELDAATPEDRPTIEQRNHDYAGVYHGDDYDDYMRGKHEQYVLAEQRQKEQPTRGKRTNKPKPAPFDPAKCESFTS